MTDSNTEQTSSEETSTPETTTASAPKNGLKQRASIEDRLARAKQLSGKTEVVKDQESDDNSEADTESEGKAETKVDNTSHEEKLTKAAEALEKGDLKTLAKLLGKDAKLVDASAEKFSVLRKKADKLDTVEGKLREENKRLIDLGNTLRSEFGTPREAARAYKNGQFGKAADALQKWFGDDFATITKNIAREMQGLTNEEKEFLKRKAALEEKEAELVKKEATTKKTVSEQEQRTQAIKVLTTKCTGHDVLKLKDGAALVLKALEDSYDPDLNAARLTIKQAADLVLEEKLEAARALGIPVEKASKKDKTAPSKTTSKTPDPITVPSKKNGKFKEKGDFNARLEAARRLTAKSRSN